MGSSTRARTRESNTFVRSTAGSQSLERGLLILRAFRQGASLLTNSDLAERVQLPRPTISRLTRSLVDGGFLLYDIAGRGYRLAPVCLSLALAYRTSEPLLESALPYMRELAEGRRVNVGLAVADQLEMVYLDSVRLSRLGIFRRLSPGSRIPMAQTSLGCAYLAGMPTERRKSLMEQLKSEHGALWPRWKAHVEQSLRSIDDAGYCSAQWAAGMAAVATPLCLSGQTYALNVSFPIAGEVQDDETVLHGQLLLALKKRLVANNVPVT